MKPPKILYHGTSYKYINSINKQGIVKINYDKVYLTDNIETAYEYANKNMYAVICVVDAEQMYMNGYEFDLINNEWLTEIVPKDYMLPILIEDIEDLNIIKEHVKYKSNKITCSFELCEEGGK